MIELILFVVFGAVVGWAADFLWKDADFSWLERIVLGVIGAVVGGTLGNVIQGDLDFGVASGFNIISLLLAIVGALIALVVWREVQKRT